MMPVSASTLRRVLVPLRLFRSSPMGGRCRVLVSGSPVGASFKLMTSCDGSVSEIRSIVTK